MITLTLSCFYPLPGKWVFIQHLPNLTMQTPAKRCWQQIHILCKIVKLRRVNPRKCVLQIRVKFCLLPAQYRKRSCCWTPASQTSLLTRNRRQLSYLYLLFTVMSNCRMNQICRNNYYSVFWLYLTKLDSWTQWCGSGSGKAEFNQKHFFCRKLYFFKSETIKSSLFERFKLRFENIFSLGFKRCSEIK